MDFVYTEETKIKVSKKKEKSCLHFLMKRNKTLSPIQFSSVYFGHRCMVHVQRNNNCGKKNLLTEEVMAEALAYVTIPF